MPPSKDKSKDGKQHQHLSWEDAVINWLEDSRRARFGRLREKPTKEPQSSAYDSAVALGKLEVPDFETDVKESEKTSRRGKLKPTIKKKGGRPKLKRLP